MTLPGKRDNEDGTRSGARPGVPLRSAADLVPVVWMAVVLAAFTLLATHPLVPTREEIPGIAALDRWVLPLLAALLAAAIIRYLRHRISSPESGTERAVPESVNGQETQ